LTHHLNRDILTKSLKSNG